MKCNKQKYLIAIGMINKGLKRMGFEVKEIIDIIKYIDNKYKNKID